MPPPASSRRASVFILSVSSEIGEQLALAYLHDGATVSGTHRGPLPASLRGQQNFSSLHCDLTLPRAAGAIREFLRQQAAPWDIFISCVGQLAPVGPFFENAFEPWADAVGINSVAQLRALHAAHPFRRLGQTCHVVFFAGGGTNNPFPAYSAYCLGKIALIKMCELLDNENPDLNVFAVGTGWVRTKIHEQTLAAGARAGASYDKTLAFMAQGTPGTSHGDIAAMIRWGIAQGRAVAGGRNFSVVHDPWRDGGAALAAALRADPGKYKLRRHSNE